MVKLKKSTRSIKEHAMQEQLEALTSDLILARKTIEVLNERLKNAQEPKADTGQSEDLGQWKIVAQRSNAVEHPSHYTQHPSGIECIQIVEHFNFNRGNAIKYIWRADDHKEGTLISLRKAAKYLSFEIQRLEFEATKS